MLFQTLIYLCAKFHPNPYSRSGVIELQTFIFSYEISYNMCTICEIRQVLYRIFTSQTIRLRSHVSKSTYYLLEIYLDMIREETHEELCNLSIIFIFYLVWISAPFQACVRVLSIGWAYYLYDHRFSNFLHVSSDMINKVVNLPTCNFKYERTSLNYLLRWMKIHSAHSSKLPRWSSGCKRDC